MKEHELKVWKVNNKILFRRDELIKKMNLKYNMEKKSSNKNLKNANKGKKDEFYTQLADIENELKHYKDIGFRLIQIKNPL